MTRVRTNLANLIGTGTKGIEGIDWQLPFLRLVGNELFEQPIRLPQTTGMIDRVEHLSRFGGSLDSPAPTHTDRFPRLFNLPATIKRIAFSNHLRGVVIVAFDDHSTVCQKNNHFTLMSEHVDSHGW